MRREPPDREAAQQRLRVHLAIIDRGVAPVVARYREHIECRPGCSECCHQTFRVSELEGQMLRVGLAAAAPAVQREISARAAEYQPGRGEPCPALAGDGTCQVYEHRPRICRKYGIPLWHPDRPEELTRICETPTATHDPISSVRGGSRWPSVSSLRRASCSVF